VGERESLSFLNTKGDSLLLFSSLLGTYRSNNNNSPLCMIFLFRRMQNAKWRKNRESHRDHCRLSQASQRGTQNHVLPSSVS